MIKIYSKFLQNSFTIKDNFLKFAEYLFYVSSKISTECDKKWFENKNFLMQMRVRGA